MSQDDHRQRLASVLAVELAAWIGLCFLAVLVAGGTLTSEFPARSAASHGEEVVLVISVALSAWTFHQRRRVAQADEGWLVVRWTMAVLRLVVLLPTLWTALLIAAAGYSV